MLVEIFKTQVKSIKLTFMPAEPKYTLLFSMYTFKFLLFVYSLMNFIEAVTFYTINN